MSASEVGAVHKAVQETNVWLKELAESPTFADAEQAYTALRAVLHSLRDRLTVEEAVHLSAQLPMLVRGFYFEGWRPALAPNAEQTREEFFASVAESLRDAVATLKPEQITPVVFDFLETKLSQGQIRHVKDQLPAEIRALWGAATRQHR